MVYVTSDSDKLWHKWPMAKWHILWAWGVGNPFCPFCTCKATARPWNVGGGVGWGALTSVSTMLSWIPELGGVCRTDQIAVGLGPMDADSPLDPRFLPDAVKGAENRGLSDEGLLPSHHKRGERCPLQQQVPFLRSTFFLHICRRKRRAPGSLGWRSRRHLRWPLGYVGGGVGWGALTSVSVYYAFVNSGVGWSLQDRSDCCGTGPHGRRLAVRPKVPPWCCERGREPGSFGRGPFAVPPQAWWEVPFAATGPLFAQHVFFAHMQAEAEGARITWVAQPSPSPMAFGVPSLGWCCSPGSPHLATRLQRPASGESLYVFWYLYIVRPHEVVIANRARL